MIEKYPADTACFVAVREIKIFVAGGFIFGVVMAGAFADIFRVW